MFEWLTKWFARLRQVPVSYVLGLPFGGGLGAARNTEAYLRAYGEIGWLFACVSRIASSVGETHWNLTSGRNGKERPVEKHPLLDLLAQPNPFWTGEELFEYTQMYLDLAGEAFWILNLNRAGLPGEVWPVPPHHIKVVPDREKYIAGYIYRHGGQTKRFLPEEVLHFKYPSPLDPYRGLGPVQALAVDLDTETFASKWNRNFFLSSARPDAVIETDASLIGEQYTEFQKQWRAEFQGVERAHRTAILRKGMTYKGISISHKDMGFSDQRKLNRDIILAAYGIPLHILGITETTNRATAESAEYVYARWVVRPRLQRIAGKLTAGLASRYGDRFVLSYLDPTPESREEARLDAESGMRSGYMTVNEARRLMKLEALPQGDILMWGIAMMPAPIRTYSISVQKPLQLQSRSVTRGFSVEEKERLGILFVRRLGPREKRWKAAMMAFYREQEQAIIEALESLAERQLITDIYDDAKWLKSLMELSRMYVEATVREAAEDAVSDYGLGIDFDLSNPRVQQWIGDRLRKFSTAVNDTQKKAIVAQLQEAEAVGEGIPQMIERIREHYANSEYRAERVARTETVYASNQGAIEAYVQAGLEKWEWLAAKDGREEWPCETCLALDGQTFPVATPFEPAHPNCRCAALPVLPEEMK